VDPDAALANMRELVEQVHNDGWVDPGSIEEQMAEQFQALDDWLSKSGFLPAEWQRHRSDAGV